MRLTYVAITNASPKKKPRMLADGAGLYLLVQPNGSRLWRFRYRFGGRENMLTFGVFPAAMLAATSWFLIEQPALRLKRHVPPLARRLRLA